MLHEVTHAPPHPEPGAVPDSMLSAARIHEQRFGSLPMADLLAPTIAYARDGFPVGQVVSRSWRRYDRSRHASSRPHVGSLAGLGPIAPSAINNYATPGVQQQLTSNGQYPNAYDGFRNTFTVGGT